MKIIRIISLIVLSSTSALALSASLPSAAAIHANPNGKVIATLPAGTALVVQSCTGGSTGWCKVTAGRHTGFMLRAKIKAKGNCQVLKAKGFSHVRKGEASYNGQRDRDGDGIGCDK